MALYLAYMYRTLDRDIRRIDPAVCAALAETSPTDINDGTEDNEDGDNDGRHSPAGLTELSTALGAHPLLQQQGSGSSSAAVDCEALERFIGALKAKGPNARLRDTLVRVKVCGS